MFSLNEADNTKTSTFKDSMVHKRQKRITYNL